MSKRIERLVDAAISIMNPTADGLQPQDAWERERLAEAFGKILHSSRPNSTLIVHALNSAIEWEKSYLDSISGCLPEESARRKRLIAKFEGERNRMMRRS